ncbi:MAG TPA: Uma2 family endonuclease, partial [Chloroflexota bacterium]|nr:Uma2 family endonuclease [Chloroflexota bacterium]
DPLNVTVPDLLFILAERSHIMTEANIQGAPDIIVEALSPSTRRRDLGIKKQLFARFGVPWYYIVDARRKTVRPLALRNGVYQELPELGEADTLTCPLLPEISMPVAAIFR